MGKWQMVRLGDVCDVRDGTHDSPKYVYGSGYPLVTSQNVTDGYLDFTNVNFISIKDYEMIDKRSHVDNGDIIMPMIGTIGKPVIVQKTIDFAIKNLALIKFYNNDVLNKFIFYYLNSSSFLHYVNNENRGGTQKFLSLKSIRGFPLLLPSLDVQQKIADVLDKASALIELRRAQLDKLDLLIKSQFVEMFGDPVMNPMGWNTATVGNVCAQIIGGGTPSKKHPEYFTGHIPWVSPKDMKSQTISDSIDHITEEAINNSSTKLVPANSVLMVIRSGVLKHDLPLAINTVPVAVNQDMKVFIPSKQITSSFLLQLFSAHEPYLLSTVRAVTADNIEFSVIRDMVIIVPPIMRQNQFASFVQQAEKTKLAIQQSLSKLELNYKSLMQKCFRGEIF